MDSKVNEKQILSINFFEKHFLYIQISVRTSSFNTVFFFAMLTARQRKSLFKLAKVMFDK